MWGQDLTRVKNDGYRRIIPTRVGTSAKIIALSAVKTDHPHACGDKYPSAPSDPPFLGSSPRVWGQELNDYRNSVIKRIIPTRVGTSEVVLAVDGIGGDHPHACGDKKNSL